MCTVYVVIFADGKRGQSVRTFEGVEKFGRWARRTVRPYWFAFAETGDGWKSQYSEEFKRVYFERMCPWTR